MLAFLFQRGILIFFCFIVSDSPLAVTALDVPAVLLHSLQAVRIPHVAGATSNFSITDLRLEVFSSSSLALRRLCPVHLS